MGEESVSNDDGPARDGDAPDPKPDRSDGDRGTADHLAEIPDGSGCTEIWEELSERRECADNEANGEGTE